MFERTIEKNRFAGVVETLDRAIGTSSYTVTVTKKRRRNNIYVATARSASRTSARPD